MDLVLSAIFLYFFVFAITRVIGRRELSWLAPFDIILLIVAGDAIQQGLTQDDSLEDVAWAVLETSGKISFIRKG